MHDTVNEKTQSATMALSVVIPVFNEEAVLTRLFDRLYPVLDGLGQTYEAVFVDDGSRDRSATLLRQQHTLRPDTTRVVYLRGNLGQDAAIMAGFAACVGRRIVTLGADLQCPPEEIPRLLAEMDRGHDYVGPICRRRHDPKWRDIASLFTNGLRERITGMQMTDPGCMLRAYDREIVSAVLVSSDVHGFIPALAYRSATNPTEIPVECEASAVGESKYPLYRLIRLNLNLLTGFSLIPLRTFSLLGIGVSIASFAFVIYLALRRLLVGPEGEGLLGLFGLLFFLLGVILFGIGLLGEYVGHVFEHTRGRPQPLVREELTPRPRARRSKG
jgi:undecaprenyl-phosphate 4-deoxy-4-formamido-L-arabinose transferase